MTDCDFFLIFWVKIGLVHLLKHAIIFFLNELIEYDITNEEPVHQYGFFLMIKCTYLHCDWPISHCAEVI